MMTSKGNWFGLFVLMGSGLVAAQPPDIAGRDALNGQIQSAVEAEQWSRADTLMRQFRKRYPPSSGVKRWNTSNEVVYLFEPSSRLANHLIAEGELERALAVYDESLRSLSPTIPHYEWGLVAARAELLVGMGGHDVAEVTAELERYQERFSKQAERVESEGRRQLFRGLATRVQSKRTQLALLGRQAPEFAFERAYNAELPFSLADARGKVVLIDFWATWCPPCIAAWPKLEELRERYGDRLLVLGVTSLKGSYSPLTPEKELEQIESLIDRHQVKWPILLSDRVVNDPDYSITTLPAYAILDRDGTVAGMYVGSLHGLAERTLGRLLGEPGDR